MYILTKKNILHTSNKGGVKLWSNLIKALDAMSKRPCRPVDFRGLDPLRIDNGGLEPMCT